MQQPTRFEWLSLGQLLLSGLGFLLFAGLGAVLLFMGVAGLVGGSSSAAGALPFFSLVWICGLVCLLQAPSLVLSSMRLLGKPRPGLAVGGKLPGGFVGHAGLAVCHRGRGVGRAHRHAGLVGLAPAANPGRGDCLCGG